MVVPIYLVSFFLYQSGIQIVRERLFEAEAQQARIGLQNLEQEVARVQAVMLRFTDNYPLRKLALESTINLGWDNVEAIRTLQESLYLLSVMSPLVDESSVWLPYLGRTITPFEVLPRPAKNPVYAPIPDLVNETRGFSLQLSYPVNHETSGLQFLVNTLFSGEKLQNYLEALVRFPGSVASLIHGPQERVYSSKGVAENPSMAIFLKNTVRNSRLYQSRQVIQDKMYLVTQIKAKKSDLRILLITPEEQILGPLTSLSAWFLFLTVLTLALVTVFAFWLTSSIERPLKALIEGLTKVELGDLKVNLFTTRRDEFGFLYRHFDQMVASLDTTMTRLVEQEILVQQAELKQLQYQINPHFLYNSIYHMYRMARADDFECIADYALHLGSYFEFITRGGSNTVTLGEEAIHTRNYCEIQRIRFAGRIEPEIAQPSTQSAKILVPRLILQPLLENAYNHGLANSRSGGLLRLNFEDSKDFVVISVEDNGEELADTTLETLQTRLAEADEGRTTTFSGIVNIHRRLTLQFGYASALRLSRSSLGGLKVCFQIPVPKGGI
ncbi:MAG: histidine kinase [Spirochaetales bacterium]